MPRKGPARDLKKELYWRGILRQHRQSEKGYWCNGNTNAPHEKHFSLQVKKYMILDHSPVLRVRSRVLVIPCPGVMSV